ncbi:Hypothetical protein GLP15_1704 [Giardia lamblia P15]|uniref:Uncharacterized protein n=1 Tax=Giardia intestinalis (strain P15) TaxID=658858 RepID=E1EW23_GIAIA|nr:Hypothetical protein GLP15_1704 [Giardia lamblia P15]
MSCGFSLLNGRGRVALSANGQLFAYRHQNVVYIREATREMPIRAAFQIPTSKDDICIEFSFCGNYILYYALPTDVEINLFRLGSESSMSPHLGRMEPERILPYSSLSDRQLCIRIDELGIKYATFSPNLTLFCVTATTSETLEIRFLSAWAKPDRASSKSVRFSTHGSSSATRASRDSSGKSLEQSEGVLLRAIPGAKSPPVFSAELSYVVFVSSSYCQDKLHIIGTTEQIHSVVDFPNETFDTMHLSVLGQKSYLLADFYNAVLYKVQLLTKNEASVVRYEVRVPYQFTPAVTKTLSLAISAVAAQDVHIAVVYVNSRATLLSKNLQERMVISGLPDLLEHCESVFIECRCKELASDIKEKSTLDAFKDKQNYCACGTRQDSAGPETYSGIVQSRETTQGEIEEYLIYQEVVSITEDSEPWDMQYGAQTNRETVQRVHEVPEKNHSGKSMHYDSICPACGLRIPITRQPELSESHVYDFPSINTHSYLIKTNLNNLSIQYASRKAGFQPPKLLGIEAYLKRNTRSGHMSKARFSSCCRFLAYVGVEYPTTLIVVDPLEMKLLTVLVFYDVIIDFVFVQSNLYILTSALAEEYRDYNLHNELDEFSLSTVEMKFEGGLRPVVATATGNKHLPGLAKNRLFKWSPRGLPCYIPLPQNVADVKLKRMCLAYNDIVLINTDNGIAAFGGST